MTQPLHSLSKFIALLVLFSHHTISLSAQIGGDNVYEFLNLSPSARVSGLAGNLITVRDDDVALAFANPALLNSGMHQQLSFNHNLHMADVQHGYASYGHHAARLGLSLHGGIQYLSYGEFDAADAFGQLSGTFKASEYALTLGGGRQLYDRLSVGANLKLISSQLESYTSYGLSADMAAFYQDSSGRFSATLLLKNIATQLSTYQPDNREAVPFEIQIGISQRLKHLPFRLSVVYHNLQRWNILYDDPNVEESTLFLGGDQNTEKSQLSVNIDNFFRHMIFSGEFLFGKKEAVRLRLGYNHLLRKELTVRNFRSLAGFAFGMGIKINRFRIEYGRQVYHLAGGSNHFSISTNIAEFRS